MAAKVPKKKYDTVIIEATYATHEHPDRKQLEVEFVKAVKDVVNDGGKVLIPAFAVGRSREVFSMLQGGTAIFYMEKLGFRTENAIFLVSFQVPGTGGSKLLEQGTFTVAEK